ncbi:MAG: hypothetical protein NTX57_01220 [Armatimonadetes bacterium]|nr:hypothetical protein [Armatimonadota bacterium]
MPHTETFESRFELVLPRSVEEKWRAVGWRTNLMAARDEAQRLGRPVFLWIMVGNPQGCT